MRWVCALLALGLVAACGGGDDAGTSADAGDVTNAGGRDAPAGGESAPRPPPADVDPFFTVGTGARSFEPLTEGQQIPIIQGIQGGFHVWGGFRAAGFSDANLSINFTLTHNSSKVADAQYTEPSVPRNAAGEYEYAQVAVVFFDNDDTERLSGEDMVLSAEVTTEAGERYGASITVVPVCCQ